MRGLQYDNVVPPLPQDPGCLEPRGTGADDDRLLHLGRRLDHMAEALLPPSRGVVDALGVTRLVDRVETEVGADAGPDPVLVPGSNLADQVRVRDLCPRHTDQVDQTLAQGETRRGDVRDTRGVHHRHVHGAFDLAGEAQVRR